MVGRSKVADSRSPVRASSLCRSSVDSQRCRRGSGTGRGPSRSGCRPSCRRPRNPPPSSSHSSSSWCSAASPWRRSPRRATRPCRGRRCVPRRSSHRAPHRHRRGPPAGPACAMNALMWPMSPPTTMSTPFIEMPHRAAALPSMTRRPPCAVAPADCDALPLTHTRAAHHVLRDAGARVAVDGDLGVLVHARGVVADVAVDGDLHRRSTPTATLCAPCRVFDDELAGQARGVQGGVHFAQRHRRRSRVEDSVAVSVSMRRPPPARAPRSWPSRRRAGRRARGTRWPSRPSRRSRR